MKRRIPMVGDEQDALTPWKRVLKLGRGFRKAAKKTYAKRLRKVLKAEARET